MEGVFEKTKKNVILPPGDGVASDTHRFLPHTTKVERNKSNNWRGGLREKHNEMMMITMIMMMITMIMVVMVMIRMMIDDGGGG